MASGRRARCDSRGRSGLLVTMVMNSDGENCIVSESDLTTSVRCSARALIELRAALDASSSPRPLVASAMIMRRSARI
jgi:hypothetical protein